MFHLTARVAWHDTRWNGCVCRDPAENSFCVALDRIREGRDDEHEDQERGTPWDKLDPDDLPPCKAESGAYMSPHEWTRSFVHPYADNKKAAATHGHLLRTLFKVPEYATFAVPFAWMLRSNQKGMFRHSIRPDGVQGFLLPYHDYLKPTGDEKEDRRRLELLEEIAVAADPAHMRTFSYGAELAHSDVVISTLARCLEAVRRIRAHGIAEGPWERREEWLNSQIAASWKDRGAFPGLGPALEALGMRLGTALSLELLSSEMLAPEDDPWPLVDAILRGEQAPPQRAYEGDLKATRGNWTNLPEERRDLLRLLSRFALSPTQARRWFDSAKRSPATLAVATDGEILANPYRMSELDLGGADDPPVSVGAIDRGLLPDPTIAARHPVEEPSAVHSPNDARRIRAAIVAVLRNAAANGDSLLSTFEALKSVAALDLSQPCTVTSDWPVANQAEMADVVDLLEISVNPESGAKNLALQLHDLKEREKFLRRRLEGRAKKVLPSVAADWSALLVQAIEAAGGTFDSTNERHVEAQQEQAAALAALTSRRLSVLAGRAGTGKTSVMGALALSPLSTGGILFLAPTGKARVRLSRATGAEAKTVAQFLHQLKRYDGVRQRPLFDGKETYRKERTVVIDECSMLTMDDLMAVIRALDLAHVQRIILVGDPNQLPPIGVGRPFADLVAFLDAGDPDTGEPTPPSAALARLTVEVRMAGDAASDTLRLASWFTREPQPVDADRVLSELELGSPMNDLEVLFWESTDDLHERLLESFGSSLGLKGDNDRTGFDDSLGFDERGWVPYDAPDGAENLQILSPVRRQTHGVHAINRWVQKRFRAKELANALQPWGMSLGDECIVARDKVIQTSNEYRDGYLTAVDESEEEYLANGEVGLVANGRKGWLNVVFAGRPGVTFGYGKRDFRGGAGPLELAYALTVHKAQGSEFSKVFVVLPKQTRLLSRELLYTALTRSREKLVLLVEGDNVSSLFDLTRPEKSETARRNTNLFSPAVREDATETPYAEHLIHSADKGHLVRSKSELVIANLLYSMGIEYKYERLCEGTVEEGKMRPDFSFVTPDGDLILWEHLGMMNRESYRRSWEWKQAWYERNGYVPGESLFTTVEDGTGGLDTAALRELAAKIRDLME